MHPWRERLARWFTPIARHTPLSPNAITGIALALNLCGAVCLALGVSRPYLFLVAVVFIGIGGLADAFDGIVARVQGKSSRFGDFLDHVADRVSDTAIAAAWMMGSGVRQELTVITLILVGMNGYIGTQIEATYDVRNYESLGRGEFVLALVVFPIISFILATNGWLPVRYATLSVPEWLTIALMAFASFGVLQRIALASRLDRER